MSDTQAIHSDEGNMQSFAAHLANIFLGLQ